MRSEQTTEDLAVASNAAEGVPGALTDQPPGAARSPMIHRKKRTRVAAAPTRESRKSTRNFEMDKTISHVREVPGKLRRLSVAVVVDLLPAGGQSCRTGAGAPR